METSISEKLVDDVFFVDEKIEEIQAAIDAIEEDEDVGEDDGEQIDPHEILSDPKRYGEYIEGLRVEQEECVAEAEDELEVLRDERQGLVEQQKDCDREVRDMRKKKDDESPDYDPEYHQEMEQELAETNQRLHKNRRKSREMRNELDGVTPLDDEQEIENAEKVIEESRKPPEPDLTSAEKEADLLDYLQDDDTPDAPITDAGDSIDNDGGGVDGLIDYANEDGQGDDGDYDDTED